MFSIFIYINILFIGFIIYYTFSLIFGHQVNESFYLLFSLFSISASILMFLHPRKFQSNNQKVVYLLLYLGFFIYGISNFIWYFDSQFLGSILPKEVLNFGFVFQVLTKFLFFFLIKYQFEHQMNCLSIVFKRVLQFNILFLLISLVLQNSNFSDSSLYEYFFIFESIFTVVYLINELPNKSKYLLDLRLFIGGSLVWLFADLLFIFENKFNLYSMGGFSDFVYFLGFYVFVFSCMFRDYIFSSKLKIKETSIFQIT